MFVVLLVSACGGSGGGGGNTPVSTPNTAPTAANASVTTAEDTALTDSLPAATDAEGSSVSYNKQTDPMSGTVTVSSAGSFTYTPTTDFNGDDSFTYSVSDGSLSTSYTVSITVTPVNDAPTLAGTAPAFDFTKGHVITSAGTAADQGRAIAVDPMGRIVVAGLTSSDASGAGSAIALVRYTSSGELDPTFGTGGVTTTEVGSFVDNPSAIIMDSADRIVVVGSSSDGTYSDTVVLRYTSTGVLDPTFGGGDGIVVTSFNGQQDYARSVALDSSENIVVLGETSTNNLEDIFVARYTTDGELDATFGSGGVTIITGADLGGVSGSDEWGGGLEIDSSNRIVISGLTSDNFSYVVARLTPTGDFDTTFAGGDGFTLTPAGSLVSNFNSFSSRAMALDANGQILVVGCVAGVGSTQDCDFVTLRYSTDGVLDSTFGSGSGYVITAVGAGHDTALGVAPDSLGGFVLAGASEVGTGYDTALVRYTGTGEPDSTFGGDGIVVTPIATANDFAEAVSFEATGKILIAGTASIGGRTYIAVSRYLDSGAPDDSFFSIEYAPFLLALTGRFADVEDAALTLAVTLADDSPLPPDITFDTASLEVSGRVPPGATGLKVTATDTEGVSVSETYLFQ